MYQPSILTCINHGHFPFLNMAIFLVGRRQEPGTCLGPGCCWGGFRALFSCCGTSWKCMPKPQAKAQLGETGMDDVATWVNYGSLRI